MSNELAIFGGSSTVTSHLQPWPPLEKEEIDLIVELAQRSEISYYGKEGVNAQLEEEFIKYHNCKYALSVSSGTASLHSAFVACGIGQGDEVIAPTHTFLATVTPILMCNAIPILVDCEEDNEGIDPIGIEKAITSQTKAM
ncbi:aminotransferase class I/II-fold pyridoxal phosphate-dependent enzyme [Bacillus subtilis]|uniref:aminotransferase class I/II-fold pyridoxal phosphate-dependent enzyme n=1 Tax=Bacillus subtilis TaxID=1423 RepID=UPI0039799332